MTDHRRRRRRRTGGGGQKKKRRGGREEETGLDRRGGNRTGEEGRGRGGMYSIRIGREEGEGGERREREELRSEGIPEMFREK